jgi:hypothetical protein
MLHRLFHVVCAWLTVMRGAGVGRFDSINGTYDEQTSLGFDKTQYAQMLTRTVFGSLVSSGKTVADMVAGGPVQALDTTAVVRRKKIGEGDMVRHTLTEAITGIETFGDTVPASGNYLAFQNQEVRVNQIDSPIIPVQGRNAQRRAKGSLPNIPASVKDRLMDYMAQGYEIRALLGLVCGASPEILKATTSGGLGDTLGVRSSGTAGKALMARHFFTQQAGIVSFSSTQATYNSSVNTAVGAITAGAAGMITLASQQKIRAYLDTISFDPPTVNGKKYKAVCLATSNLWWRMRGLLGTNYVGAMPRAEDNKIFTVDDVLVWNGILYINCQNLQKLSMAADGGNLCPSWGVGSNSNVYASDLRSYTNSNTIELGIYCGAGALLEGYDDSLWFTEENARHGKGVEYCAHVDGGFKRGEWYAQDGRTGSDAAICNSCLVAAFYETGVGT